MKKKFNEVLKNGIMAGIFSGVISWLLNYYIIPFPNTIIGNAAGHAIGGFFCGSISAIIGILIYINHLKHKNKTAG